MILLFPDADAVRLALTSGLVPADVTLAPAAVSTDDHGRLYVEPSVSLSRATGKLLDRLGVKGSKRHGSEAVRKVGSWVELVPLAKEAGTPEIASGTAVLFELPTADDLPAVVAELLRLGNDRQGFRWFAADGDADATRVLLRVIGPPYYTLLRALDGPADGMRVYLERAPRVWVAFGYTHPLAEQVRVAEGQFALLTPLATWRFVEDAPFRDVYDLAEFPLPAAPVMWEPVEVPEPVTVPLRLTAGNAADAAELWVLRDDPVGRLDALVRDADERLTQRLTFAVAAGADGSPIAVLRTRPSKEAPPVLALEGATGFKPYWKLPNLFLPVGRRLHPTLRRDAVRRLLADDPNRVVWLFPDGPSGFTPESVPDAAFRSLEDWIDYVIEVERAPLAAWIGATQFDFEHFVCNHADGPKPKPDRLDSEPTPTREPKDQVEVVTATPKPDAAKPKPTRTKAAKPDAAEYVPPPPEALAPNEAKVRAKELADEFLAVEGPLDDPARKALWPRLAQAYTDARDAPSDAAVCWLNALWDHAEPQPEWEAGWAAAEFPHLNGRPVGAAELDAKLKGNSQSAAEPRAAVAAFLAASSRAEPPDWLASRLQAVQHYSEKHYDVLPIRAVWLVAVRLARLVEGDRLGLNRTRDRLLGRLHGEGVSAERDLPGFLRFAGLRDADRLRAVREALTSLHATVKTWVGAETPTAWYVDLLFAFVYARLGERQSARTLIDEVTERVSRVALDAPPPKPDITATKTLVTGFVYRIEQALAGKPHAGPMPDEYYAVLKALKSAPAGTAGKGSASNDASHSASVIERMAKDSQVFHPEPGRDPYAGANPANRDPLQAEVNQFAEMRPRAKLPDRVRRLLRDGFQAYPIDEVRLLVLYSAAPLAPTLSEAFTADLVRVTPAVLTANAKLQGLTKPRGGQVLMTGGSPSVDIPRLLAELAYRSIDAAAHFGRSDLVREVIGGIVSVLRARPEADRFKVINIVSGHLIKSLKRLGMRDEVDSFLTLLQAEVLKGVSPADLKQRYGVTPEKWAPAGQCLLHLAGGWLTLGMTTKAIPVLDEMRRFLFEDAAWWAREKAQPTRTAMPGGDTNGQPLLNVLVAYVSALGHAPAAFGLPRIQECFRVVPTAALRSNWTGSATYARDPLRAVEEVVWALTSDEFSLGPTGRKWLDDDESLVRKRINGDVRPGGA